MNKLIYLTGQIESPFFFNEISAFCKTFDDVIVIAYDGDVKKCDEISNQFGFQYELVSKMRTINPKAIIDWRKEDYVREELKRCKGTGLRQIKKRAYVYLYGIYGIRVIKALKKHIEPTDNLYIYSFWLSRPAYGVSVLTRKHMGNVIKSVSRTHRYDLYEEENDLDFLPFRKFICETLDTIYFSSIDTVEYYKNKHYSPSHNPIYKLSYLGTREFDRKNIISKNTITIASCSAIIQRKRLDLVIRYVKELGNIIDVIWIHIGDGEQEKQIKQMANTELQGIRYKFTGRISDDEIYDLYKKEDVDFFINLSDSEGIPVSIMEAMSLGIPVIARNVGGIGDAITDGVNGFILDNIESIRKNAERVAETFQSKEKYRKMADCSYKKWDERFNGKKNIELITKDIIESSYIKEIE